MKIALVVPGGVDRSGEVRVIPALLSLIERLARVHEVHVFALHQEARAGRWELLGAHVHNVGAGWSIARGIGAVLRVNSSVRFDLLQSIFAGNCGLVAVSAARLLGKPACVHVAGGELVALHDIGYGGCLRWYGRAREGLVLANATAVSAASAAMIDAIGGHGVSARRIPLGVDLTRWPPAAPQARGDGETRLVHLASLNRVKDQTTLLAAAQRLAERGVPFVLDVIGEDTLGGAMQNLANRLGLESRVRFHGFLTHEKARAVLARAHLHLVSSRHEAGPLSVLEAAVCGVPTVGTSVGHIAEWTPDAAVAVPVADPQALADAVAALLANEPRRLRLAQEAQARAVAADADGTARLFFEMYASIGAGS
jgi:glycosyltransferase involved in cell wall biosynthesis